MEKEIWQLESCKIFSKSLKSPLCKAVLAKFSKPITSIFPMPTQSAAINWRVIRNIKNEGLQELGIWAKWMITLCQNVLDNFLRKLIDQIWLQYLYKQKKGVSLKNYGGEMVGHSPCLGENISFSKNKRSSLIFDKLLQYKRIIPHIIPHTKKCTW